MESFNLVFLCYTNNQLSENEEQFLKKNFLSLQEIEIANEIKDAGSKCIYLQSHSFKRKILAEQLKNKPGNLEFYKNYFGKPFLVKKDKNNDLFFNLSHTDGMTAMVVSSSYNTGIDVEKIKPIMDFSLDQKIIFHPKEWVEFLDCKNHEAQTDFFFRIWVVKECYLKAMGNGFGVEPSQLLVVQNDENDFKIVRSDMDTRKPIIIRHGVINGISTTFTTNEKVKTSIDQFVFDEKFEYLSGQSL